MCFIVRVQWKVSPGIVPKVDVVITSVPPPAFSTAGVGFPTQSVDNGGYPGEGQFL